MTGKKRPAYLDLRRIKLPLPGMVSILHRISGALLFLALPFLLYVFQASLSSPAAFSSLKQGLSHPLAKLAMLLLAWAAFHHFFAGLRYLALDMHVGAELRQARRSSKLVLAGSLALTVLTGIKLW
jgi:succinate dehydrogenase / fumarate reductase cytochrome b subunit